MENPKKELILAHHFSHEHPLELITNLIPTKNTACFGCKLSISSSKFYYKCKTCPFYLHQVCHNMPKSVQHPSDPNHSFNLKSMPPNSSPDSKSTINCKVCDRNLFGLYYNCDRCGDFYHILCSVVPLSVKTPSHQHTLKLEYAPPYDFQCDSCRKPSYNGWLYRCSLCEFDVHVACAITNKGAKLLAPRSPMEQNASINKEEELMELLTRGLGKGSNMINNGESEESESNHSYILDLQDQPTPLLSDQDPSCASYQFSDACFSIDFAKSLLGSEDGSNQIITFENRSTGLEQVKEIESPGINKKITIDNYIKHVKQESISQIKAGRHSYHRNSSADSRIILSSGSRVWLQLDPETVKNNEFGFKLTKSVTVSNRSIASDNVKTGCSFWSKGIFSSLFYCRGPRVQTK